MCGRFIIMSDLEHIQLAFPIDHVNAEVKPSYNLAPTQPVAAIVRREGKNNLEMMRWGLIPVWAKDVSIGAKMINARAETLAEKPSFKRPLKSQRCLIVADGFYEWQKEGAKKIPMFIRLKDEQPFGFAGLYDVWKSPEGKSLTTCTIITTTPNKLMEPIHDRMPVILPASAYSHWLDPANQDLGELMSLLRPYPASKMVAYPVSTAVNSPRNNSAELIRRVNE